MHLFSIIFTKEIQVVHDTIHTCDVTGVDTLSAAKICMKNIHDSFLDDGYEILNSRSLSDSYSWLVFKKENVTYEIQLTKAIV